MQDFQGEEYQQPVVGSQLDLDRRCQLYSWLSIFSPKRRINNLKKKKKLKRKKSSGSLSYFDVSKIFSIINAIDGITTAHAEVSEILRRIQLPSLCITDKSFNIR